MLFKDKKNLKLICQTLIQLLNNFIDHWDSEDMLPFIGNKKHLRKFQ